MRVGWPHTHTTKEEVVFFFGSLNQNLSSIQTTNAYTTHIHTCAYIHHVHIEQQPNKALLTAMIYQHRHNYQRISRGRINKGEEN